MLKTSIHYRNIFRILFLGLLNVSCKIDTLLQEPNITPESWLSMRPSITLGSIIFNEPLGSFLVFLLAALWILAGVYFLKKNDHQRSRIWFGIALVLGGLGAFQAGISYQAFSYELKCRGQEFCLLTNAFEVGYSLTQAVSVSCMLTAVALACTKGFMRTMIIIYCGLNAIVYVSLSVIGLILPSRLLLSFEILMLFALPGILFVIIISSAGFIKTRSSLNRSLLWAALQLVLINGAYFWYFAAGITQILYKGGEGFYFSENDVLHVGMILWLIYVVKVVGVHLQDFENTYINDVTIS